MIIYPNIAEQLCLNIIIIFFNGSTSNPRVRLFQNDYTPDADTLMDDFVEADFSGYAAFDPTWPTCSTVGGIAVSATSVTFGHDGGGTGNTIYGWYLDPNINSTIVGPCERFPAPIVMDGSGDEIIFSIPLRLRQYP